MLTAQANLLLHMVLCHDRYGVLCVMKCAKVASRYAPSSEADQDHSLLEIVVLHSNAVPRHKISVKYFAFGSLCERLLAVQRNACQL